MTVNSFVSQHILHLHLLSHSTPSPSLFHTRTRRWSYIESNSPTFSYAVDANGAPLAMTVSPGIRSCQGWLGGNHCSSVARRDGRTFADIMELARKRYVHFCRQQTHLGLMQAPDASTRNQETHTIHRNPRILIVVDWNSWIKGESESEELTNSFEPSVSLGTYYIDLLGAEIARCAARVSAGVAGRWCNAGADVGAKEDTYVYVQAARNTSNTQSLSHTQVEVLAIVPAVPRSLLVSYHTKTVFECAHTTTHNKKACQQRNKMSQKNTLAVRFAL